MKVDEERVQWFFDNWPSASAKPAEIREAERKLAEWDALRMV